MSNKGKKVKVHYVGTLDDGTVFDSSRERDKPIEFVCMTGRMIPGFDRAVDEMQVGEVRDIHLEPQDAYGMPDPKKIFRVVFDQRLYVYVDDKPFPTRIKSAQHGKVTLIGEKDRSVTFDYAVGDKVKIIAGKMGKSELTIVSARNDKLDFDTNHRLAGKALNFNIELLEVED